MRLERKKQRERERERERERGGGGGGAGGRRILCNTRNSYMYLPDEL